MNRREQIIRRWFYMWLSGDVEPIESIFDDNVIYTESWGPQYEGIGEVRHWFEERHTRGKVLIWDIKQFVHDDRHTIVEWYFKDQMEDGRQEDFDGTSLIEWNERDEIVSLKEFGSKPMHYNPYEHDRNAPCFRDANLWT